VILENEEELLLFHSELAFDEEQACQLCSEIQIIKDEIESRHLLRTERCQYLH